MPKESRKLFFLGLLSYKGTARPLRIFAYLCAGTAMVIGMLTLSEHLFGWNLGIDQLLAQEPPGALGITQPNRMGPPPLGFSLAGLALLLVTRRPRGTLIGSLSGLWRFPDRFFWCLWIFVRCSTILRHRSFNDHCVAHGPIFNSFGSGHPVFPAERRADEVADR